MPEYLVNVTVTSKSEDKAIKELSGKLKEVEGQAKKTGQEIEKSNEKAGSSFTNLAKKIGSVAAAYFGVKAAIDFVSQSFRSSIEDARLYDELASTMRGVVNATDDLVNSTKDLMSEAEKASGIQDDKLIPAYKNLLTLTKDVTEANALFRIAVGAAARQQGDLESNVANLVRLLETGAIRGTDEFSIKLRAVAEDGKLTAVEIANLTKQYGDMGASIHNAGIEMDRNKVQWENMKETLGYTMQNILMPLMPLLKSVAIGFEMVAIGIVKMIRAATWGETYGNLTKTIEDIEEGMANLMMPSETIGLGTKSITVGLPQEIQLGRETKGGETKGYGDANAYAESTLRRLNEERKKAAVLELKQAKNIEDIITAYNKLLNVLDEAKEDDIAKAKSTEEKQSIELRYQNDVLVLTQQTRERVAGIQKQQLEYEKEFRQTILEQEKNKNRAIANEFKDFVETIIGLNSLLSMDSNQMNYDQLREFRSRLKEQLALYKQYTKDKEAIGKMERAVESKLNQVAINERIQQTRMFVEQWGGASQQLLGMASATFGQNKAMGIAEAIINTSLAIMKTMSQLGYPAGVPFAIAMAAMGAAQVAKIASTNPEKSAAGGYDIPAGINPVVQAHAEEMILPADIATGFREIINQMGTTSISNYDQKRYAIRIQALSGAEGKKAAREVAKRLRVGQRFESKTRIS